MQTPLKIYQYLTYSGSLPFVAGAVMMTLGLDEVLPLPLIISSYTLLILSFMCGVHWGTYLYQQTHCRWNLFLTSNIVTLIAWFGFLTLPFVSFTLLSAALFALLLWLDYELYKRDIITVNYWQTRRNVTMIVVVSLLATVAA